MKVYIGAPAQSGAGLGGYVDAQTLGDIVRETRKDFTSFGGVMLWDIYLAQGRSYSDNLASLHSPDMSIGNGNYNEQIKSVLTATTTAEVDIVDSARMIAHHCT